MTLPEGVDGETVAQVAMKEYNVGVLPGARYVLLYVHICIGFSGAEKTRESGSIRSLSMNFERAWETKYI